MFGIGPQELIVVFLIVLLLFGGRKIPEIARGLGKGIREFKNARDACKTSLDAEEKDSAQFTTNRPAGQDDETSRKPGA